MSGGEYKDAVASGCGPMGDKEGILFLLTQHLPLQRALRALGHAGPTCRRAYGAGNYPRRCGVGTFRKHQSGWARTN